MLRGEVWWVETDPADQIMAADRARLKSQLGTLSNADMQAVEDAIKVHLALPR